MTRPDANRGVFATVKPDWAALMRSHFGRQVPGPMTSGDVGAGARTTEDGAEITLRKAPQGLGVFAAACGAAAFLFSCQADAASHYGLVHYDHPVYRNGKRVLWHGAWRGNRGHESARTAAKASIVAKTAPAMEGSLAKSQPQSNANKPFSIIADPDDLVASRMARDYAEVLNDKGAPGRAIVGPTSPTGIAKVIRTDMADFAIVTLDTLIVGVKYAPDWPQRAPIVARLAPEMIEIVAPKEVKSIADLAGMSVSFGDPDSATGITAKLLFSRLGVAVDPDLRAAGRRARRPRRRQARRRRRPGRQGGACARELRRRRSLPHCRYSLGAGVGAVLRPVAHHRHRPPEPRCGQRFDRDGRRANGVDRARRSTRFAALRCARADGAGLLGQLRRLPVGGARRSLARRQSRRRRVDSKRVLAAVRRSAGMARRTKTFGRQPRWTPIARRRKRRPTPAEDQKPKILIGFTRASRVGAV